MSDEVLAARRSPLYRVLQVPTQWLARGCLDLKAYGTQHVPRVGGVLLVSNHQSHLDPPLVGAMLPRALTYLARSTLFENKYFSWLIRSLGAFPVAKGKGDVGAIKRAAELLQAGHAVLVFPEGTRSPDGKIQSVQPGAALIVRRAKVPVVPVALDGAFTAWPRRKKLPTTGRVRIKYGAPMLLHDLDGPGVVRAVQAAIAREFAWLRENAR